MFLNSVSIECAFVLKFNPFLVCIQSPGIQRTKGVAAMLVYTTKECNYNSIVIVHQQCGYDVTCKPRIRANQLLPCQARRQYK